MTIAMPLDFGGGAGSPISPFLEMGAYEYLMAEGRHSFKTVAELFARDPEGMPTDYVEPAKATEYAHRAYALMRKASVTDTSVRIHGAGEYPAKLRHADHPIELLYFRGVWDLVEMPSVAIVGTREPSSEGVQRAKQLARLLAQKGFAVVSGLAKGIDTAAHTEALRVGGRTIAVIGTSLAEAYPKENRELQEHLARTNLVISQVPFVMYDELHFKLRRTLFPQRNITMSALTDATVIVEAGETSGTLTQARAALSQGRKLFILNSCFENPNLKWPHSFAERGAIRVRSFDDVLEALGGASPKD